MRRLLVCSATVIAIMGASASGAVAARNPAGSGQPGTAQPSGAACGSTGSTSQPAGFTTSAFTNTATVVYAGSPGTPSAQNGNGQHAISEYDIACYQQTQNH